MTLTQMITWILTRIASSMPAVDAGSVSWRQEIRKEIIVKHENPADEVMGVSNNKDVDEDL